MVFRRHEVTFDYRRQRHLNVTAKDKATGKEQSDHHRLDQSDKGDVETNGAGSQHEQGRRRPKALIEARNMGDSVAYQAKSLRELGDKVDAAMRNDAEAKIRFAQRLQGDDVSATNATNALQESMQKIGSAAYQYKTG